MRSWKIEHCRAHSIIRGPYTLGDLNQLQRIEVIELLLPEDPKILAREALLRLCPHAPKDLPFEKSTTMQAYMEGYLRAKAEGDNNVKEEKREL